MAIAENSTIWFYGTQDEVTFTSTTADAAFQKASTDWTNDDDAPMASFTLELSFSTTAADANTTISLYAELQDIESGNTGSDMEDVDANHKHIYICSFPADSGVTFSTTYFTYAEGVLPAMSSSQVMSFWIENNTGQTMAANAVLHITPKTYGPHPA